MLKKLNKKKIFVLLFLAVFFFLSAHSVWAQPDVGREYAEETGLGDTDPREILVNFVNIAFTFLAIVAVIIIIYAGYLWMTSGGNSERIEKAKKVLLGAVIGLILILSSFAIVNFIINSGGRAISDRGGGISESTGILPGGERGAGAVSCDSNNLTSACETDHEICGKYGYCDSQAGCICQTKSDVGGSCNQSSDSNVCEPADFMCLSDVCGEDCTCISSPVIYSVSPVGGFCNQDIDMPCNQNDDCATGTCNMEIPNGKPGNLVTISGHYFGTTSGEVEFNGIKAAPPESENSACSQYDYWTDTQVVVVVPSGISSTNTIEIIRSDDLSDATDDAVGPSIPGFLRNDIERPGLCGINPDHGQIGDDVNYDGLNLSGSLAYFGNYNRYIEAYNSNFEDLSGNAKVPSVDTGTTTTFASSSGVYSNYLAFHKDEEPYSGPFITSFNPTHGPSGEYVTISGGGFGDNRAGSMVYFGTTTYSNREGNFDFPEVCGDSFWSDNEIIVKVPEGASVSNRIIYIDIEGESIISTAGGRVSPSTFQVESGEPGPGLCKIKPTMGSNGLPFSLWGEYFGSATGSVIFSPEVNQNNINYWGKDKDAQRVDTLVPEEAISGSVGIKDTGGNISNTMNFEVGLCTEAGTREEQNDACGPEICCPVGTYKEGRCATTTDDCYIDIPNSVFEWEFVTGVGTSSVGEGYESCQERSLSVGTCSSTLMCPNTTGKCSFNTSGVEIKGKNECGDEYCGSSGVCANSSYDCEYNESLNVCLATSSGYVTCDLNNNNFENIWGEEVTARCNSSGHWYFDSNGSCPEGWSISSSGGCVDYDSDCDPCASGFSCLNDQNGDNRGYCGLDSSVCSEGAECVNGECMFIIDSICECCCRIEREEEDCCSFINPYTNSEESLMCAGVCGSDENPDDDSGFGNCTGCRIEDESGNVDQEASDQACVCSGNTGQFCDTDAGEDLNEDGKPDGVCRDCAVFNNSPVSCSEHHSTCCVDVQEKEGGCRGGEGDFDMVDDDPDLAYCQYFQCDPENPAVCATEDPVPSSTKAWASSTVCAEQCGGGASGLGESCETEFSTSSCNLSICSDPYSCITESGSAPDPANDCGFCCCTPGEDDCKAAGLEGLNCQADKDPCTGDDRGLCCGCKEDSDCSSSGNPLKVGCGLDTCCRARPEIESTNPDNKEEEICSNARISATFNSPMNIDSFTGNILVAGQYSGSCPEGTTYIAKNTPDNLNENKNLFTWLLKKIEYKLKYAWSRVAGLFGGEVLAWNDPGADYNYCAVPGTVKGKNLANGNTKLTFLPTNFLDTDRIYFVIVRGDEKLNSERGVLSNWGVGLNSSSNSPVPSDSEFNGISYPHSYIWSFRTLPDQGNQGVCEVDHVNITPDSYLFKTTENSLSEDDSDPDDDSVSSNGYDRDKIFYAEAKSSQNQTLSPIPGVYDWDWSWEIMNSNVVARTAPDIPDPLFSSTSNKQLIIAQEGVEDARTEVAAEVNLIGEAPASYGGDGVKGISSVSVFLCNNPWPPFDSSGTWQPWRDRSDNCDVNSNDCKGTNYQFYYCRDSNNPDITADDLPALVSDNINIGKKSYIIKESYFFHEETPDVSGITLQVNSLNSGGGVQLNWTGSVSGGGTVGEYKIYYRPSSQESYNNPVSVSSSETSYNLTGLENGQEYCFAVTAVFEGGGESDYSQEKCVTPEDTDAPDQPNIKRTIPQDGGVKIAWEDKSGGEAVLFKIYYRASTEDCPSLNKEDYGSSVEIPYQLEATSTVSGLTNGVRYCFGLTAVDEEGNESDPNTGHATPFADPSNLVVTDIGTSTVNLGWGYTDGNGGGVDELVVYYGTSSYNYDNSFAFYKEENKIQISNLATGTDYFFNLRSRSNQGSGYESNFISEVSATTSP